MTLESLDEETAGMMERLVVVRISTKHINLWMRQLEMKRNEITELAGLMGLEWVEEEIERAKDLEMWAKRCTHHFTKKGEENVVRGNRQYGVEWRRRESLTVVQEE